VNGNARLLAVLLEIDRDGAEAIHRRVLDQPVELPGVVAYLVKRL
jgi:hypothetical protein